MADDNDKGNWKLFFSGWNNDKKWERDPLLFFWNTVVVHYSKQKIQKKERERENMSVADDNGRTKVVVKVVVELMKMKSQSFFPLSIWIENL